MIVRSGGSQYNQSDEDAEIVHLNIEGRPTSQASLLPASHACLPTSTAIIPPFTFFVSFLARLLAGVESLPTLTRFFGAAVFLVVAIFIPFFSCSLGNYLNRGSPLTGASNAISPPLTLRASFFDNVLALLETPLTFTLRFCVAFLLLLVAILISLNGFTIRSRQS
jgi:hypothetical protein